MANINDGDERRPLSNRDSGADVWRSVLESKETGRNMPGAANRARRRETVRKDSVEPQNPNAGAMPYTLEKGQNMGTMPCAENQNMGTMPCAENQNMDTMPFATDKAPNMDVKPFATGKGSGLGAMPYASNNGPDMCMMPYAAEPNMGVMPFETGKNPNVGMMPFATDQDSDMGAMPYEAEPNMYAMPYGEGKEPNMVIPNPYFDREIDLLPRLFPDENLAKSPYPDYGAVSPLTMRNAEGEVLMKTKEAKKDEKVEKYIMSELDDAQFYRMLARKAPGKRSSETLNKLAAKERKHAKSLAAGLFITTGTRPDIREKPIKRITASYRDAIRNMYLHERDDAVAFMRMSIDSQDPVMSKLLAGIAREEEESATILLDLLQAAM